MPRIRGIAVNFRFGPKGFPEPAVDIELLNDSIYSILKTKRGERVHRPSFGCDLHRLMFANMSREAKVRARTEAREAIALQEKRVIVDDIVIEEVDDNTTPKIKLTVIWRPLGNPNVTSRTAATFGDGG